MGTEDKGKGETTGLSVRGIGRVVPASWYSISEDERAVYEYQEWAKDRPGYGNEVVEAKEMGALARLGAPMSRSAVQNRWQLFLLLAGNRPLCLECDHCGFIEWTEVVMKEASKEESGGYVAREVTGVRIVNGIVVPLFEERYIMWLGKDIGEKRYYWCNPSCLMNWERARPRLNRQVRKERTDRFVLGDGQAVEFKVKATG